MRKIELFPKVVTIKIEERIITLYPQIKLINLNNNKKLKTLTIKGNQN